MSTTILSYLLCSPVILTKAVIHKKVTNQSQNSEVLPWARPWWPNPLFRSAAVAARTLKISFFVNLTANTSVCITFFYLRRMCYLISRPGGTRWSRSSNWWMREAGICQSYTQQVFKLLNLSLLSINWSWCFIAWVSLVLRSSGSGWADIKLFCLIPENITACIKKNEIWALKFQSPS